MTAHLTIFSQRLRPKPRSVNPRSALSARMWPLLLRDLWQDYLRSRIESKHDVGALLPPRLDLYELYQENNALQPHLRQLLAAAAVRFSYRPICSIIMPVYDADPQWLRDAIGSVQRQICPHWQLCIADDASNRSDTLATLAECARDGRISVRYRTENGHISRASNDAADLARGESTRRVL